MSTFPEPLTEKPMLIPGEQLVYASMLVAANSDAVDNPLAKRADVCSGLADVTDKLSATFAEP